jgi:hypothetical protein
MERKNCWEIKGCGRQPGGDKVEELGVCSAALPGAFDSVNKGECAGRFCWAVAGTLCGGKAQGTYAKKLANCLACPFLLQVQVDEGRFFVLLPKDAPEKTCT